MKDEYDDFDLKLLDKHSSEYDQEFGPILKLDSDGQIPNKLPDYAYKILEKDFGHKSFKKYQEEAIIRICSGQSALVVLSTGYGKSLIYQMAARLYAKNHPGSTVLVVSPLISLMQDQLQNLSKSLKAAVCDSNLNEKEYHTMIQDLNDGKINVLFMSPEAIINRKVKHISKLAFVCIDEVHCLSQWSHNFRPSYLQLCQVLDECYNVKCILGLTATATNDTIEEIRSYFDIDKRNILKDCDLPPNLLISASIDSNKDKAIVDLIKSEQFRPFCSHVIIYCSRRETTEKLAQMLRLALQTQTKIFNLEELAMTKSQKAQAKKDKTKKVCFSCMFLLLI
jgi:ATP-dependent DNA helicase Q4